MILSLPNPKLRELWIRADTLEIPMLKLITVLKRNDRTGKMETFVSHGVDTKTNCDVNVPQDRLEDSGAQFDAMHGWHFPDTAAFEVPQKTTSAPPPFGFFCELIDGSTGEILRSEFTRDAPRTGDHGLPDCLWHCKEIAIVAPPATAPEAIADEALAQRLLHAKTGVSNSAWSDLHPHERASWLDAAKTARALLAPLAP